MRSIDGQSGAERPWQHVSNSGQYSPDGFCTSIVSRRHPDVYVREGTNPGFIYSSSISDLISCSYIQDAGSGLEQACGMWPEVGPYRLKCGSLRSKSTRNDQGLS